MLENHWCVVTLRWNLYLQSENETLKRGDVIKKIDDYDARDVRHVDAQNLLQNSESIRLVVERSEPSNAPRIDITTSSSPIIESNTGDRAAVTSLSESNSTFVIMRFIYRITIYTLLSLRNLTINASLLTCYTFSFYLSFLLFFFFFFFLFIFTRFNRSAWLTARRIKNHRYLDNHFLISKFQLNSRKFLFCKTKYKGLKVK